MTHASLQFTHSIAANIVYWRQQTKQLNDDNLPTIDRDRQNLFRAVKFGLLIADTWRETAELIMQNFLLVERRGYWIEWIPLLEQLLDHCPKADLALRGRLLDHLGIFYRHNRQLENALAAHQDEYQIGLELEDKWRQAHASINLGTIYRLMHRYAEAEQYILKAQKAFQAINAPTIKQAFVTLELGLLAYDQGQWSIAEEHLNCSVALWRKVNDPVYLANSLKILGQVLESQHKIDAALDAYHESLDKLNQTGNYLDKIRVQNELATLHLGQENLVKAQRLLQAANASFLHHAGNLFDQAIVSNNMGKVCLAQGHLQEAERTLQRSITLWQVCDDQIQLANSLGGLAEVKMAQGDIKEAQRLYRQALILLDDYPYDVWGQKLKKQFNEAQQILNCL